MFLTVSASVWVYLLLALSGSQTYACGRDNRELCSTLTGARALSFPAKRKSMHQMIAFRVDPITRA